MIVGIREYKKMRMVIIIFFIIIMIIFCGIKKCRAKEAREYEKYKVSGSSTHFDKYLKTSLPTNKYKNLHVYKYIHKLIVYRKISIKNKFFRDVKIFKKTYNKTKIKKKYKKIAKTINKKLFKKKKEKKYGVPPALIAAIHFREDENDFKKGSFSVDIENGDRIKKSKFVKCAKRIFEVQKRFIINTKLKYKSKDIIAMCVIALCHNGVYPEGEKITDDQERDINEDEREDLRYTWRHSAYIFSGTNQFKKGKFTQDGELNKDFVDKQVGVLRTLDSILG